MARSKRFEILDARDVHKDGFTREWPEVGMVAMNGPFDPKPSITIEQGTVVEMDGKRRDDFDFIEQFIADHYIDTKIAPKAMAMDSREIARMLVDINVPRKVLVDLAKGMTPAKVTEVLGLMNVVEMMMAVQKMRSRRTPGNQAHVTNRRDNPVMLAADAAEAALRGFLEVETTVGVVRYAPFNALALLVGSQVGRPGVLTQDALEEAMELLLGMRGLTAYAETISVYGTERVFIDGDDTPYSKAFLASAYASRGIKMRYTSGTGSEVQMAYAEGNSMLYLEVRCVMITKAAGVQGLQNGSISCIGVTAAVPAGIRAVLAENLCTVWLDLEVASGNDQTFSHSPFRRTARTLMQMLPGTDYIFSGYSAVPNVENMFAGSNWDVEDVDDYLAIQRDLQVEGGLQPVAEEAVVAVRHKAAKAMQAVFRELGFPPITDQEVEAVTYGHTTDDIPARNVVEDLKAAQALISRGVTGVDVVKALAKSGFEDVAQGVLGMLRLRVAGDYLQTAAFATDDFRVVSAVNDSNDYAGPGTGYRLTGDRWDLLKDLPFALDPKDIGK